MDPAYLLQVQNESHTREVLLSPDLLNVVFDSRSPMFFHTPWTPSQAPPGGREKRRLFVSRLSSSSFRASVPVWHRYRSQLGKLAKQIYFPISTVSKLPSGRENNEAKRSSTSINSSSCRWQTADAVTLLASQARDSGLCGWMTGAGEGAAYRTASAR